MTPLRLLCAGTRLSWLVATSSLTGGCGPPVWRGNGWVDRLEGEFAVLIVAGREVVVTRARLPVDVSEGDYVRDARVIPSRRKLSEQLAGDKLVDVAD